MTDSTTTLDAPITPPAGPSDAIAAPAAMLTADERVAAMRASVASDKRYRRAYRRAARALVDLMLRDDELRGWSNVRLGDTAGCSAPTVRAIRLALETAGEIEPTEKRIGSDGRGYPPKRSPRAAQTEQVATHDAEVEAPAATSLSISAEQAIGAVLAEIARLDSGAEPSAAAREATAAARDLAGKLAWLRVVATPSGKA